MRCWGVRLRGEGRGGKSEYREGMRREAWSEEESGRLRRLGDDMRWASACVELAAFGVYWR